MKNQNPYNWQSADTEDSWFWRNASIELMWCWWPRRCHNSKKWLSFCLAYRARRIITGPGKPVVEDRWYSQVEGLVQLIKVNSN